MVITKASVRTKGCVEFPETSQEQTQIQALFSLMVFEVAYGGQVEEITPRHIRVRTNLMGCIDITRFDGSDEEMRPLVLAVYYYLSAFAYDRERMETSAWQRLCQFGDEYGANALIVTHLGPIILSQAPAWGAMLMALGITDERELAACMILVNGDLETVLELRQENPEVPLREILQLVR